MPDVLGLTPSILFFRLHFESQTSCKLSAAGHVLNSEAVVSVFKNPLPHERIAGGKHRIPVWGEDQRVRAQDFTSFQIGFVRGAAELGDIKLYVVLT